MQARTFKISPVYAKISDPRAKVGLGSKRPPISSVPPVRVATFGAKPSFLS